SSPNAAIDDKSRSCVRARHVNEMEKRMRQHGRVWRVVVRVVWLLALALVAHSQATITKTSFGKTDAGENIDLYTLRNTHGVEAKIMNYGGIVVSLKLTDRNCKF